MISNCLCCENGWNDILEYAEYGYYIATTKDHDLFERGHLVVCMVDEYGTIEIESGRLP